MALPDLLLEVGCEELPSSACREILEQAGGLFAEGLGNAGFTGDWPVQTWVAPRRFALFASVPSPFRVVRPPVRGPAEGAPERAVQGFARAQGVTPADLEVRPGPGDRGFWWRAEHEEEREVVDVLPAVAAHVLEGLRFSKTMRWGDGTGPRFSRPVRWLVAKADARVVPFTLHDLEAGETSRGHRFLGGPARVATAGGYREALREVAVVADHAERRAVIVAGLDAAAEAAGAGWRDPGGKLDEVVFLVEWPSVLTGSIAEEHMRLPARVLVTAMQSHQRYFPLSDGDGALRPAFLAVSNGDPGQAELITRGNEDVLDARLQDAAFSYDRDREAGLAALDARLDAITFHQRLGSMAQKRDRLVEGVAALASRVGADPAVAVRAAALAKADQGAVLVAEFADLQGYVAAEYALLEGHPPAVAQAIEEQYLPEGPDSPLPASEGGALLAAAEKVDNLVGAFAVDEVPSGSKDPYGLRRAAAGLVRILLDRGWDVEPAVLFIDAYPHFEAQAANLEVPLEPTAVRLESFLGDRLEYLLGLEGVGAEAVAAARGAAIGGVPSTAAWARAIEAARGTPEFEAAWTASTRVQRLAAKGPADVPAEHVSAGDPGEDALDAALREAAPGIEAARDRRDFGAALGAAAGLGPAVDRFFTDVLVNDEDPATRARRYGLVRAAARTLTRVADFAAVTQPGGAT